MLRGCYGRKNSGPASQEMPRRAPIIMVVVVALMPVLMHVEVLAVEVLDAQFTWLFRFQVQNARSTAFRPDTAGHPKASLNLGACLLAWGGAY
jgi:hypothetical protein